MTEGKIEFLKVWIEKNVTPDDQDGSQLLALALAERCIAEAAKVGITLSELEPTWGTTESIIYEAMRSDEATMRELWRVNANDTGKIQLP